MTFGDLILLIPFLKELRQCYPDACISLVCGGRGSAVCRRYPWIDEVINLAELKTWRGAIGIFGQLARLMRSDRVFALYPFFSAALIAFLLAGRKRLGFAQARTQLYVGRRGFTSHPSVSTLKNWIIRNVLLTNAVEMQIDERHASTRFNQVLGYDLASSDTLRGALRDVYPPNKSDIGRRIILAPFSGWQPKNWPIERWVRLGERLVLMDRQLEILVCCELDSKPAVENAFGHIAQVKAFCPGQDFDLFFRTFAMASLLVSNDSFPLHVGSALNVPSVGIFGPTLPKWFGSLAEPSVNLFQVIECNPCLQKRGTEPCLKGLKTCAAISTLTVDRVAEECLTLLGPTSLAASGPKLQS